MQGEDLTVDTQIMAIGSGKSDQQNAHCTRLLLAILGHKTLKLAIDKKGKIEGEYTKRFATDPACLGKQILNKYRIDNRLIAVSCSNDEYKPVRLQLRKLGLRFDASDQKFVQTAMATQSKRLVAEEKGYSKKVCTCLKKHARVVVMTSADGCTSLGEPK